MYSNSFETLWESIKVCDGNLWIKQKKLWNFFVNLENSPIFDEDLHSCKKITINFQKKQQKKKTKKQKETKILMNHRKIWASASY